MIEKFQNNLYNEYVWRYADSYSRAIPAKNTLVLKRLNRE